MVWGAICCKKKTPLFFIDGNLNSMKYQDLLNMLLPNNPKEEMLAQDNAPFMHLNPQKLAKL